MTELPTEARGSRRGSMLVGGAALLWAGFLSGVSLLATPIKFQAPSLDLPVALDVGRVTFAALNKVEIAAAVVLIILVLARGRQLWSMVGAVIVALLVAAQTLWLLPGLDARVQIIIDGGTPPESSAHLVYIVVEGTKLLLLAAIGVLNLWAARRQA